MSNNLLKAGVLFLACLAIVTKTDDQGDWVNTFRLDIGFIVHPFYAGYLNITTTKAFYYVYYQS